MMQQTLVKVKQETEADHLKMAFVKVMVEEVKTIPDTPTKEQAEAVALSMPHIAESATELEQWLEDDDLIISRVNSPPLGAHEKSKKELQYPAACGGAVYSRLLKDWECSIMGRGSTNKLNLGSSNV